MYRLAVSVALSVLLSACGGAGTDSAPQASVSSSRANLQISVVGEPRESQSCMLRISANNQQERRVTLMLTLEASAPGAELSSPTITAAFGAEAGSSGQFPDYALSGAPCSAITLRATRLMCMGAGECVAEYQSSGLAGLVPPQD